MRECKTLEFKENITKTFLKTVSAFSNYDGGTILFGVDDDGNVVGLDDVKKECLAIENAINDNISPQPDYTINIQKNNSVIVLNVKSGLQKPYLYKSKAYKRNDSSTIEVDTVEFSRLVLEGKNITFEELPAKEQNLTFNTLCSKLKTIINIDTINKDILKTLNLYSDNNGYNNVALLLADKNNFPGIDIVKFGENINIIKDRYRLENISVIDAYEKAIDVYRSYYQYELIDGSSRKIIETIPEASFREAIANAIIHRSWDVSSQIRVSMYDDRIEVVSPGGLSNGISEEEYLTGKLSVLRNKNLAYIFLRLGYVEIFGTGITRIKQLYHKALNKPNFKVLDNSITIILPIYEDDIDLTNDEKIIYDILSKTILKSISDIQTSVPFGKSKTIKLLKSLVQKGVIMIDGRGRGTKYIIK